MFIFGPEQFLGAAGTAGLVPLIFEARDVESSPAEVFEKMTPGPGTFFLDSAGGGPDLAKYSFIGAAPLAIITVDNADPLSVIKRALADWRPAAVDAPFPFWGGAVGFLSYDAVRHFEDLPCQTVRDLDIPDACFTIPGILIVFSHRDRRVFICINQPIEDDPAAALAAAEAKLDRTLATVLEPSPSAGDEPPPAPACGPITANVSRDQFENMVARAIEYIYAGDVFQVNLSVRFGFSYAGDPYGLYKSLRRINPSPFAAYLDFGDWRLASSSPERLVRLSDGTADTRPIAGTRRRGRDDGEDRRLEADLLLDAKERAEHTMLIDLERNDLGRVSEFGSVKPTEMFAIEKYSHVIHIVSNVRSRLAAGRDQFDLVRAMFPGGTITGCPKIRCMEIIEELEPTRRGPYTGGIGYFGFNGNMDMNIIIRSFVIRDGVAFVQAGAGIVADSRPAREYDEACSKAAALLQALGMKPSEVEWETTRI